MGIGDLLNGGGLLGSGLFGGQEYQNQLQNQFANIGGYPYWSDCTTSSTVTIYNGGLYVGAEEEKPAKPTSVLGWLDERVESVAEMGRELLEAA